MRRVPDEKVIALCGHIRPTKGFHRIISLLPELNTFGVPVRILIMCFWKGAKYSIYRHDLNEQIRQSPCSGMISLTENKLRLKDYNAQLSLADLVVLPYEAGNWGHILTDAVWCRKPVVSSDLSGMADCVRKFKLGLVVKNDIEMSNAIRQILFQPQLHAEYSLSADKLCHARIHSGFIEFLAHS